MTFLVRSTRNNPGAKWSHDVMTPCGRHPAAVVRRPKPDADLGAASLECGDAVAALEFGHL
jgi:hypothetical protein